MADSDTDGLRDILRKGADEFRRFVNPLIAMRAELADEPVHLCGTREGALVSADGQVIEDLHGTQAFGHRHPAITAAVQSYLASDAPSWFPSRVNPFAGRLARRLCERTGYGSAFFGGSGSEAVEAGLKLARAVTRRPRVLSMTGAYHGCTFGSCALMTPGVFRDPFAPHLPGVEAVPLGDRDALARAMDGDVAAVVVEPIQLEGGVRPLSPPFLEALLELTARHGALLIADEVQTGMGRSGHMLLSSTWQRPADVALLGKSLGGGLLPISAMLTRAALFAAAYGRDFETAEAHNSTFSGNAACCVAALAALDLLSEERLSQVSALGAGLREDLQTALQGSPLLGDIRGQGLIVGIELVDPGHPWLSFEHFGMAELGAHATIGLLLCHRLYRRGFFCFVCGHDWRVLRLQPRFTITPAILKAFVAAVAEEVSYLCQLI